MSITTDVYESIKTDVYASLSADVYKSKQQMSKNIQARLFNRMDKYYFFEQNTTKKWVPTYDLEG